MKDRAKPPIRARFAGQTVVCVYARHASGPGWSNSPLWVILRDGNGKLKEECLQPDEQPEKVLTLYRIAADVDSEMTAAVRWWLR